MGIALLVVAPALAAIVTFFALGWYYPSLDDVARRSSALVAWACVFGVVWGLARWRAKAISHKPTVHR